MRTNQGGLLENKKAFRTIFLKAFEDEVHPGGDPAGTRTQGPYIKSVLLYQLSYGILYTGKPGFNGIDPFFKWSAKIREKAFAANFPVK